MKYCRYCGKEIHEKSSFCPYCMQSQVEKKSEIIYKKNSKKWIYILLIAAVIIIVIAVLYFALNSNNKKTNINSSITTDNTETVTTTSTEAILTTITTSATKTKQTTTKTETTVSTTTTVNNTSSTETTSQKIIIKPGDYITEGKNSSQIMGYGGYEDIGGTILTIEGITDNILTFTITLYSESGYASDTLSVRNITSKLVGNTTEFEFTDNSNCNGAGKLTFENGKIHIETWGESDTPTTIILNEYLN